MNTRKALAALAALALAVAGCGSTHAGHTPTASPAAHHVTRKPAPTPEQVATRRECKAATRIYDQVTSAVTVANLLSSAPRWMTELKQAGAIPDQVAGVPDGRNPARWLAVHFAAADLSILLADQQATNILHLNVGKVRRDVNAATTQLTDATALCPAT